MPTIIERIGQKVFESLPHTQYFDLLYARIRFLHTFKRSLNLDSPSTLNEKIQWLKIYNRRPIHTSLADKYEVRNFVADRVGSYILNEVIAVYNKVEDINLSVLPDSFVMRCTHGSGMNIICKNKTTIDWEADRAMLHKWMNENYYGIYREWHYKNIQPRILCEKFIHTRDSDELLDYKIFCFAGKPHLIQVDLDRFTQHSRNLYDLTWNKLPVRFKYPVSSRLVEIPSQFEEMKYIAEKLSEGFPFMRVDLYSAENRITFGELTFHPGNGFEVFTPHDYDLKLGKLLVLPVQ